ncbi:MAG: TPM domain-containing protein [Clostridia bacterium]|nr:TPM domain-containing protein [Clostridia bacterium]
MKKVLSLIFAVIVSASLFSFISVSAVSAGDKVTPAASTAFNPVADFADIFTGAQEDEMREKIAGIRAKYGYELVIVTDVTPSGISSGTDQFYRYMKEYCEDYWFDNGLGAGADQTGSMLFVCMENIYHGGWWTASFGGLRSVYTEDMINAIDDRLEPDMRNGSYNANAKGEYGTAVLNYLDSIDAVYAAGGGIPFKWKLAKVEFKYPIIVAIIVGLIAGVMTVSKQKRRMKTVEKASRARGYLREGSFRRNELGDVLIGVTVTKTARSSSSSSGGKSHYSSSGRSSGGGRSF